MKLPAHVLSLSREPLIDRLNETNPYESPVKSKSGRQWIDSLRFFLLAWSNIFAATVLLLLAALGLLILSQLAGKWIYERLEPSSAQQDAISMAFSLFEREMGKEWPTDEEREYRWNIFGRNYLEAAWLNYRSARKDSSARFGVNGLADMSEKEFAKMLLPKDHYTKLRRHRAQNPQHPSFINPMNPIFANSTADGVYPAHFDWRDKGVVTPVKWQGKCGSCWAFATVATVESAYAIAHGQLRNLSEQELLDCNLDNNACKGGDVDLAFHFVHRYGLVSEVDYPYVAARQNTCAIAAESERTKIDVAYYINPDEQSMMDWLVNFGPVNIGINVPPDMKPYRGGVYRPSDYDCKFRLLGTHALLIVGYGTWPETGEKYWILKNSWGRDWGVEQGYVYFARGINACGIEDEPVGLLA